LRERELGPYFICLKRLYPFSLLYPHLHVNNVGKEILYGQEMCIFFILESLSK